MRRRIRGLNHPSTPHAQQRHLPSTVPYSRPLQPTSFPPPLISRLTSLPPYLSRLKVRKLVAQDELTVRCDWPRGRAKAAAQGGQGVSLQVRAAAVFLFLGVSHRPFLTVSFLPPSCFFRTGGLL